MSDPRIPEAKQHGAQLPDDLDQIPGIGEAEEPAAQHGSEDAQLLAGEGAAEGDVENAATAEAAPPDDLGATND